MPIDPTESTESRLRHIPPGAIVCIVGARPNFIKIAPIMAALRGGPDPLPSCLVHTGQYYDPALSDEFFRQLRIPTPDIDLEVGSSSHAVQTAQVMMRFEPVVDALRPSLLLVVGDVNSTVATALVAAKKGVPIAHVEAGLRSYDRGMPEEINRVLTDQISDLLFTTEAAARANLVREGIDERRIHFVGNVMVDTLRNNLGRAVPATESLQRLAAGSSLAGSGDKPAYALVTLHRPSNVDRPETLRSLVDVLAELAGGLPVVFPVHPRTRAALARAGLEQRLESAPGMICLPPLGYLEMLGLMAEARIVLTDSGGIQEETTALGIPCVTLRENTERPITVTEGTNTVVGTEPARILGVTRETLQSGGKAGRVPELWDGQAAGRIREVLVRWLGQREPA